MTRFAITIFLSAFLLFQVQPLIGKYILSWFGGASSVWTTCMLFFQAALLAGYAYAHGLSRLPPRRQAAIHVTLLLAAALCLPIAPSDAWRPTGDAEPVSRILLLLAATIGLPYFLLSATGPLLQDWFSRGRPERSPYRLYALSNVGSLLALISYPLAVERWMTRRQQVVTWSVGFALFSVLCAWCAWRFALAPLPPREGLGEGRTDEIAGQDIDRSSHGRAQGRPSPNPSMEGRGTKAASPSDSLPSPSFPLILFWLLLSAAGSAMLLATTNQLTGDVAVVPFLWVVPLSLYLLTFILCFDSDRWYRRGLFGFLLALAAPVAVSLLYQSVFIELRAQIIAYGFVLFICCMGCHGELARSKPAPRHLTLFYLTLATGGALGGLLVAVAAPLLMSHYFEYHAALFACVALIALAWLREAILRGGQTRFSVKPYALAALVVIAAPLIHWGMTQQPFRAATWAAPFDALASAWSLLRAAIGRQLAAHLGWAPFATAGGVIVLIVLSALIDADRQRRGEPLAMRWVGAGLALLALGATLLVHVGGTREAARHSIRNFYGVVHVEAYDDYIAVTDKPAELGRQLGVPWWPYHEEINLGPVTRLVHGRIIHGVQFKDPKLAAAPTIYYGPHSGVGLALTRHPKRLASLPLSPWERAGVRAEQASADGLSKESMTQIAPSLPLSPWERAGVRAEQASADGLSKERMTPIAPFLPLSPWERAGVRAEQASDYGPHLKASDSNALTLTLSQRERGPSPLHVGVVGLGAGCLAVYARPGDRFTFYEINPAVLDLAQRHFTYLRDCPAAVTTRLGDGRVELERQLREQGSQQFDVLILDAFSGDAIPIHLLTAEAVDLYFEHLKPDGLLAIHISNRFVNLEPVCEGLQHHLSRQGPCEAVKVDSPPDPARALVGAWWVVLTRNKAWASDPQVAAAASAFGDHRPRWARSPQVLPTDLADLRRITGNDQLQPGDANPRHIAPSAARREPILWTDDFASLWEVLSF